MKKYWYNNEEVKVGNPITVTTELQNVMLNLNMLKVYDAKMELNNEIIKSVSKRANMCSEAVVNTLNYLKVINIKAYIVTVAKEIALILDRKYDGHIKNCAIVYYIDLNSREIKSLDPNSIKSFKNIAVFRTFVDALVASEFLNEDIKKLHE